MEPDGDTEQLFIALLRRKTCKEKIAKKKERNKSNKGSISQPVASMSASMTCVYVLILIHCFKNALFENSGRTD